MNGANGSRTLVFSAPRYDYMSKVICSGGHFVPGIFHEGTHPNGEVWGNIPEFDMERARDGKVVVIGSTDRGDFEAMLAIGTELARVAEEVNYLVFFSRYATKERRDGYGDVVAAKNMCERLSDAPAPGIRKRVFFLDLHADQMEFYCDRRQIITEHIRAHTLFADVIRANMGPGKMFGEKVAIGSADYGRKSAVMTLADELGVPFGLVAKERTSASDTRVLGQVVGDVAGRTVLLLDDMLRGGSTCIGGAKAHLSAGAESVWVLVTHPDFVKDPLQLLRNTGLVKGVIFGDTYPNYTLASSYPDFAHVIPTGHYVANILATRYRL